MKFYEKNSLRFILCLFFVGGSAVGMQDEYFDSVPIESWLEIRDKNVVKQELDFTCGAAALATILRYYYGVNTSEGEIIQIIIPDENNTYTLLDLVEAAENYGFVGKGYKVSFDQLKNLTIPVIVHLDDSDEGHFSVVQTVDQNANVILADSIHGQYMMHKERFMKKWIKKDSAGIIFTVLPGGNTLYTVNKDFTDPLQKNYNMRERMSLIVDGALLEPQGTLVDYF